MINFHTRRLTFYPKGNRLFKEGDYEGASHVFAQAVELFGPRPVIMSNLAAAYMKLELFVIAMTGLCSELTG